MLELPNISNAMRGSLDRAFGWHGCAMGAAIAALEIDHAGVARARAVLGLRAIATLCALGSARAVVSYFHARLREANAHALADQPPWTWTTWPARWRAAAEVVAALLHAPPLPALARAAAGSWRSSGRVVEFEYSCGVAGSLTTRELRCACAWARRATGGCSCVVVVRGEIS